MGERAAQASRPPHPAGPAAAVVNLVELRKDFVASALTRTGLTTLSHYATDKAGNVEATQDQSVLNLPGLACTATAPGKATIPAHGTITLTATIAGHGYPFTDHLHY